MPGSKQPERTAVAELVIDLALATDGDGLPTEAEFRRWVGAAIGDRRPAAEVSIRVVSAAEMQGLNQRWRGMDRPTNVLAFPAELPDSLPEDLGPPLLGDIVLCRDRVLEEARDQGKPAVAHWAHLTIHGTLHLIGYDHGNPEDAEVMESIERETLSGLGYPDPYQACGQPS